MEKRVIILGSGVIGLTVANLMLDHRWQVYLISKDLPQDTTSAKAGALWFPYHAHPPEKIIAWAKKSYEYYQNLAKIDSTGVSMVPLQVVYMEPPFSPWWEKSLPPGVKIEKHENPFPDYKVGYSFEVPMIHPPVYLNYLFKRFFQKGGLFQQKEVQNFPKDLEKWKKEISPILIHASGLGARNLFSDSLVYPSKGHMVQLDQTYSQAIFDEASPKAPLYIFPRPEGALLGGTVEEKIETDGINLYQVGKMLEKTLALASSLQNAKIRRLWTGLRPCRKEVCLKREQKDGFWILHNYGHGGCGFTVAWGAAWETLKIAEDLQKELKKE